MKTKLITKDSKYYTEINNYIEKPVEPMYTIILLDNDKLIGFYQIVEHDNDQTHYTPWIANVYIKEEYRHQGYGKILIKSIPDYLKKLNISPIYLHTRHKNLYEKFNWQLLSPLYLSDGIKRNIYILKK